MKFFKTRKLLWCCWVGVAFISAPRIALAQPDVPAVTDAAPSASHTFQNLYGSPDGRYAAQLTRTIWFGQGTIRYDQAGSQVSVWEISSGRLKWQKRSQANTYIFGGFSPDSRRFLAFGGYIGEEGTKVAERGQRCDIWETDGQNSLNTLQLTESETLVSLIFSPDGQSLIGQTLESQKQAGGKIVPRPLVKVWNAKTGALLHALHEQPELNQFAMWTANLGYLATYTQQVSHDGNRGNGLYIWSLPDFRLHRSHSTGEKLVSHTVFSPDGKKLAFWANKRSANETTTDEIYLWDLESDVRIRVTVPGIERFKVRALTFSPDSQTLTGAGTTTETWDDSAIELWFWDARNGASQRTVFQDESSGTSVLASQEIYFLPDGKHFLTHKKKGKIELRSLEDSGLVRTFE